MPTQPSGAPFDIAVVVSFGYFLTADVLRSFGRGAFNFHPSLLPKYDRPVPCASTAGRRDSRTRLAGLGHGAAARRRGRYRGASPLQYALMNGDRTTGMTVLEISPLAWDAGRILLQRELVRGGVPGCRACRACRACGRAGERSRAGRAWLLPAIGWTPPLNSIAGT